MNEATNAVNRDIILVAALFEQHLSNKPQLDWPNVKDSKYPELANMDWRAVFADMRRVDWVRGRELDEKVSPLPKFKSALG